MTLTRRKILRSAATGAAALATPYIVPASVFGANAPSNRIAVGLIGAGNRGFEVMKFFLHQEAAQVIAVCDVNRASFGYRDEKQFCGREPAQKAVNDHYAKASRSGEFKGCDIYSDFRELLARRDIDAVAVVVPDHWHGLMTVMACEAGKDIYCEKPMSLTIPEGRAMVTAVRKHRRILQTGSHERSNRARSGPWNWFAAGGSARLSESPHSWATTTKSAPAPAGNQCLCPKILIMKRGSVPRRRRRITRIAACIASGSITTTRADKSRTSAPTSNDMAQWAMGADDSGPIEVELLEAKFLPAGSLFNTATETKFRMRYASGVELVCQTDKSQVGARFEGTDGMVQTGYAGSSPARVAQGRFCRAEGIAGLLGNGPHGAISWIASAAERIPWLGSRSGIAARAFAT